MVKGIELEPSYIFTHYALGRWYYEVRLWLETSLKADTNILLWTYELI